MTNILYKLVITIYECKSVQYYILYSTTQIILLDL